jgi:translation elongation factor EF-1beta
MTTYVAYGYGLFVRLVSGDAEVYLFDTFGAAEDAQEEFEEHEDVEYAQIINTYKNGDANA